MQSIAGNTPCGATPLSTINPDFVTFNNSGNSDSGVTPPPYGGYLGPDMWFSFIMPNSVQFVLNPGTMTNPAVAIYQGPCDEPKLLYNILDNNCNDGLGIAAVFNQLNSGEEYFIRVWPQDGSINGSFNIYLNDSPIAQPEFFLANDATNIGECISLTSSVPSQQGCAWFELPMDFSQPFTNTMTANFGNIDANGADGICLIYQTNGPDYCGISGGGIGAEGMPNSAIFEFDTWQNGDKNDPIQDHAAFNVNGNMNHAFSIGGPVELGNIEDGEDHTITFSWDPIGNIYQLYFDDVLILSGSYDIINNCFGGSSTAWWGYTSATGAAYNNHIICPNIEDFQVGTQEYQEATICDGEYFNGYNEAGFYVDLISAGDCYHQVNTFIEVLPVPEPTFIDTLICFGESVYVANQWISSPGYHTLYEFSHLGCDSIINLEVEFIEGDLAVGSVGEITCEQTEVELTSYFESSDPNATLFYNWNGPEGSNSSDSWMVGEPGNYSLAIEMVSNGVSCIFTEELTVDADTLSPELLPIDDIELGCTDSSSTSQVIPVINGELSDYDFEWIYNNTTISTDTTIIVIDQGNYILEVTNPENGCSDTTSFDLTLSENYPEILLQNDTLTCYEDIISLSPTINGDYSSIEWSTNDSLITTELDLNISEPGNYLVTVENEEGCVATKSIVISIDTSVTLLNLNDVNLPCDSLSTTIQLPEIANTTLQYTDPNNYTFNQSVISADQEGTYYVKSINTVNGCEVIDSILLTMQGPSPTISLVDTLLNCTNSEIVISPTIDIPIENINWSFMNGTIGYQSDVSIDEPGIYTIEATTEGGCSSTESVLVGIDTLSPQFTINPTDTLTCEIQSTPLGFTLDSLIDYSYSWEHLNEDNPATANATYEGWYYLNILNTENGCTSTDSIYVNSNVNFPEIQLANDTLNCNNEEDQLNLSIIGDYLSIDWTGPYNFTSSEQNPTIEEPGTYYANILLEGNCSIDTAITIVGDFEAPFFELAVDTITCDAPTANIYIQNYSDHEVTSIYNVWGVELSNDYDYTTSNPGIYVVEMIAANGCNYKQQVVLEAFTEQPSAEIETLFTELTCANTETEISLSNFGDAEITWNTPSGIFNDVNTLTISTPGNYSITLENEYGCIRDTVIAITQNVQYPDLELQGVDLSCNNPESSILLTNESGDIQISWSSDEEFEVISDTEIEIENSGLYFVEAINDLGCTTRDSIVINGYFESPEIIYNGLDTIVMDFTNPSAQINLSVEDFGTNITFLGWLDDDGMTCLNDDCTSVSLSEDYLSTYTFEVENEYGCLDALTIYFQEGLPPVEIYVPNIFSPNNDGNNDHFTFYTNSEEVESIERLVVFDRWGNNVFLGEELHINEAGEGWDGFFNGEEVVSGVFVYLGVVRLKDGSKISKHGDVTVFR